MTPRPSPAVPRRDGPEGLEDDDPRLARRTPPGPDSGTGMLRGVAAAPVITPEEVAASLTNEVLRQELQRREREAFERTADQIRETVRS